MCPTQVTEIWVNVMQCYFFHSVWVLTLLLLFIFKSGFFSNRIQPTAFAPSATPFSTRLPSIWSSPTFLPFPFRNEMASKRQHTNITKHCTISKSKSPHIDAEQGNPTGGNMSQEDRKAWVTDMPRC